MKVMTSSFVRVQTINMKKVDTIVCKLQRPVIEGRSEQIGEASVMRLIKLMDVLKDFLAVNTGMRLSLPVIHCITEAIQAILESTLTECKVRFAPMSSEFDN